MRLQPYFHSLALAALLTACTGPSPAGLGSLPDYTADGSRRTSAATPGAVVSNASAGNLGYVAPSQPAPPPERGPVQTPNPNFRPVAFETSGSAPGIRGQYEAAARAYREAAAQSGSPEREQYLEAARQLDRQAAALITR